MSHMKLSLLISLNDQSEEEMLDRFEKLIDSLSKEQDKFLFQGDCCLVCISADTVDRND